MTRMKSNALFIAEHHSLMAAGDRAGQYLDTLGRTDLATLSRDEWERFLETILDTYGEQMRQRLDNPARFAK